MPSLLLLVKIYGRSNIIFSWKLFIKSFLYSRLLYEKADKTKLGRINFQHGPGGPNHQGWFFPMMEKSNYLGETSSCFLNCYDFLYSQEISLWRRHHFIAIADTWTCYAKIDFGLWNTTFMTGGDFFLLMFFRSLFQTLHDTFGISWLETIWLRVFICLRLLGIVGASFIAILKQLTTIH